MSRVPVCLLVSLLALTASQSATADDKSTDAKIRPGASRTAQTRLLSATQKQLQNQRKAQLKKRSDALAQIARELQPLQAKLDAQLKPDSRYPAYQRELEQLAKQPFPKSGDGPPKQLLTTARQIETKYKPMLSSAATRTGVSSAALTNIATQKLTAVSRFQFERRDSGRLFYKSPGEDQQSTAPQQDPPPPSPVSLTLEPTYDDAIKTLDTSPGFLTATQDVTVSSGKLNVYSGSGIPIVTSAQESTTTAAGSYVTVQPGYSKMKIKARFSLNDVYVGVTSGSAQSSLAEFELFLGITGTNGQTQRNTHTVAGLSVSGWGGNESELLTGPRDIQHTFTMPSTGGEYFVFAGTETYCSITGPGCGSCVNFDGWQNSRVEVKHIVVELSP